MVTHSSTLTEGGWVNCRYSPSSLSSSAHTAHTHSLPLTLRCRLNLMYLLADSPRGYHKRPEETRKEVSTTIFHVYINDGPCN